MGTMCMSGGGFGLGRVHVVERDRHAKRLRVVDQLRGHMRWNCLALLVQGDISLSHAKGGGHFRLRDAQARADRGKGIHASILEQLVDGVNSPASCARTEPDYALDT